LKANTFWAALSKQKRDKTIYIYKISRAP
jgi:hypothetical protein